MSHANEHEVDTTLHISTLYVNEPEPRKASATFAHMKRVADKAGTVCAVTGQPHPQYHHFFCEYAARDMVDWATVRGVAVGEITRMPVLDIDTHLPVSGQFFPADQSLVYKLAKWAEICFGMDWRAFDPENPESFVDSIHNMIPLHAKFHIMKEHGIHMTTWPDFILDALPMRTGLFSAPDEG